MGVLLKGTGVALALVPVVISVMSYRYSNTHGWVNVRLFDRSLGKHGESIIKATLIFRDATGRPIAEGRSFGPPGVIHYAPPGETPCTLQFENEPMTDRAAWDACFEQNAGWNMEWAPRVASVDLHFGECVVRDQPMSFQRHDGAWWRWWVLQRHYFGFDVTSFHASFRLDGSECRVLRSG